MKVLFVCYGNINRSQIAEAMFNKLSKKNRAESAGIKPNGDDTLLKYEHNNPIVPMKNLGYDLSQAKVKRIRKEIVDSSDKLIVVFKKGSHEKDIPDYIKTHPDLEFWDVDPISNDTTPEEYQRLEAFRIKLIERYVNNLVQRIG